MAIAASAVCGYFFEVRASEITTGWLGSAVRIVGAVRSLGSWRCAVCSAFWTLLRFCVSLELSANDAVIDALPVWIVASRWSRSGVPASWSSIGRTIESRSSEVDAPEYCTLMLIAGSEVLGISWTTSERNAWNPASSVSTTSTNASVGRLMKTRVSDT